MPSRINQPLSNPYGGAALLDSTPFLQLHLQQQAEQKAKKAASEKAFNDLMTDPNPEGLREVDTKGFYDRTNQWREFGIKNRELIKDPTKDNGAARNEFMKMGNEIALYTQSSKSRKEQEKQYVPVFTNPESDKLLTDEFRGQYNQLRKPLDETQGFQIDQKAMYKAKDLDLKKYQDALLNGEKADKVFDRFEKTADGLKENSVFKLKYSNPTAIAEKGKAMYKTDPTVKRAIDELYDAEGIQANAQGVINRTPSAFLNSLNDLYVKTYKTPIKTKEDLAGAYALNMIPSESREDKLETNVGAVMAKKNAYTRGNMAYGQSLSQPKIPPTVTVEDWEAMIRDPDNKAVNGRLKLNNAVDIVRAYSAATMNNVGDGAFLSPLSFDVSTKSKDDPQYQKTVKESRDFVRQSLLGLTKKEPNGNIVQIGEELAANFEKTASQNKNPKNKEEAQLYNQQKAEAFATALNEINKANGVSQRFSSNDIRKEMPLLVRYTKGDKMITAAVKLGSQEARVAFDAAKNAYIKKNTTNTTQSEFGSQSSGSGGDEGEFNGY